MAEPSTNGWPENRKWVQEGLERLERRLDEHERIEAAHYECILKKIGDLRESLGILRGKWILMGSLAGTVLALLVGFLRDRVIP